MNKNSHYTRFSQWLHWLVAGLILLQYILIELAELAEQAGLTVKQLGVIANHKSVGITVLLLACIRLAYRLRVPPPNLPPSMPTWQKKISTLTHTLLYALLFALPVSGWLMSSASAYTVSYFNLFALPDLIGSSEENANLLKDLHEWMADGLAILALLHIAAALKHHWLDKDQVLSRMLNKNSIIVAMLLIVAGSVYWGEIIEIKPVETELVQIDEPTTERIFKTSDLPAWNINHDNSHIKFTGEQAGAAFSGTWNEWSAELRFDEAQLQASSFEVTIDVNSVSTEDTERDETIRSAEFFNVVKFPEAVFRAQNFTRDGDSFIADGELTMKGLSHSVPFTFTLNRSKAQVTLIGEALLSRHQWQIGTGDWADPTWVGSDVSVSVLVNANVVPTANGAED